MTLSPTSCAKLSRRKVSTSATNRICMPVIPGIGPGGAVAATMEGERTPAKEVLADGEDPPLPDLSQPGDFEDVLHVRTPISRRSSAVNAASQCGKPASCAAWIASSRRSV